MREDKSPPGKRTPAADGSPPESARPVWARRRDAAAARSVERRGADAAKMRAAAVSIASNSLLVVFKLIVGFLSGSISIISEAAHSASDLAAALIAFFSVRAAARPPDERHQYGHHKIENVSGIIEALLIFAAAVVIIYEGIQKLIHGVEIDHLWLAVGVMAFSAVANLVVSEGVLYPTARRTESAALEADGAHLRTDVYTSLGVVVGLILVKVTGQTWLDPAFAIAIAVLILFTAYRLIMQSTRVLLDEALPPEEMEMIRQCVGEHQGEIIVEYHKLRARRSGSRRHVDLHVTVDDALSIREAHEIAHHISADLHDCLPNIDVLVHVEPRTRVD
jgi:cation diffusion facilitator family transporter